jgi:hypothetical protein
MAFVSVDIVFEPEGQLTGDDGIPRTVVTAGKVRIDRADAVRLATHYKERHDAGSLPLADESRELAIPLMEALVNAGLANPLGLP